MRKLIFCTLLFLAATAAQATTFRETFDKTYDVQKGATIAVTNVNGPITVGSWDQPRVRIRAEKVVERGDSEDAREAMAETRIEVEQRNGGVAVRTRTPREKEGFLGKLFGGWGDNVTVQYEVTVPRSMNLDIESTNGALRINAVSGNLKAETTNGRIELSRCAGTIDLTTTNGSIQADMLSLDRNGRHRVETTNGRIAMTVPASVAAEIDASTTNGRVSTDLPIATRELDRTSVRGTLNGGGAPLKLRTTNGSIEIHAAGAAAASK